MTASPTRIHAGIESHATPAILASVTVALTVVLSSTGATAQTCTAAPSGMVSWYTMEGTASDLLGANNPSATSSLSFPAGEVGQGVTLGAGGFIDIPNSASLALQQLTLDAWARPDGPGPNDDAPGSCIITKNINANDTSVQLNWTTQSGGRFRFGFFGGVISSANAFPAGTFYHVAGTYDGATFRLYVNGVLEGSFPLVQTITYSSVPWVIGANNPTARGIGFARTFNGVIDEVEIIAGALSAAEVAALYGAGTAGKCPLLTTTTTSTTTSTSTTTTTSSTTTTTLPPTTTTTSTTTTTTAPTTTTTTTTLPPPIPALSSMGGLLLGVLLMLPMLRGFRRRTVSSRAIVRD